MGTRLPRPAPFLLLLASTVIGVFVPAAAAQEGSRVPRDGPVLQHLALKGASIFTADDVLWLLRLRAGQPLPGAPEEVADLLEDLYERDGYTHAEVTADYDAPSGRLTLAVDEGRIDQVEFEGLDARRAEAFSRRLRVGAGDVYNERIVRRAVNRLLAVAQGALRLGGEIELTDRGGKRVLLIPIDRRFTDLSFGFSSEERLELFNPVDGFTPALSFQFVRFEHSRFNHTLITGLLGYGFSREEPAYALGLEQPLAGTRRVFAGAELYDLSVSDDDWRISHTEQTLVSALFKNSFKDYYRRRGAQVFGAVRPHHDHEVVAAMRWDRHEPLVNATDFSVFRDDHPYRPNLAIDGGRLRSVVLSYTFDTRGLLDDDPRQAFERHRLDDLFRSGRRQSYGWRTDWTTEIAGHGLGGDYRFDRHILNTRAYLPITPRQSVASRMLLGFGSDALPPERRFALGGIGSVHGYGFKEAVGERMRLFNVEYRLDLTEDWRDQNSLGSLRLLLFFDAGRIDQPVGGSRTDWLRGTGVGIQTGPLRIDFGFRLDDIPDSRQILVRLGPAF